MSDTYVDLDALVPSDKEVRLGGQTYSLPGDLPLEIFVKVNKASELEEDDEAAALNEMLAAMAELFAWKYKDKPEYDSVKSRAIKVLEGRGIRFNTRLLENIYKEADPKDESTQTTS